MIYHINRFATKKDAPKDQLSHVIDLMNRLGTELDVVEFYCVGHDIGGEFDLGAMYALKDLTAYRTYMFSPIHEEIDNAGLPLVSNQVSYDLTDDPDPQIDDKMAQVHRDRFAERPELRELITSLGSYHGPGTEDVLPGPADTGDQPGED
ncbi:MAG: Dabb family protein [Actinobacteria bacterium]|nr:Dabb family protein [Actinomycetota bacterium]MBO0835310.1 Dabb family protein [Actinomycetota bacterium]